MPVQYRQPRIDRDEALHLLKEAPLIEIGRRAFDVKRARHGDYVTYVNNRHVNPTNLCVYSCRFCDFAAKKHDSHAYTLNETDILSTLDDPAIREAHIVGGLWPKWGFARSLELVLAIRRHRPDIWIKAFTAVEVAYFAMMERMERRAVLESMVNAGVNQMPGGGAEVLSRRIHTALCKDKLDPAGWIEIHETAHRMGLNSNSTLLFGHIETDEEIVDHLIALRELEDRAPGFDSFIPLAYQPGTRKVVARLVSAPRSLRVVALARLVLDNIDHVKAYWPTLQEETAAAALSFGADDLDGTLGQERIMQLAGTTSPSRASAEHLEQLVRHAGQIPQERDGAYRPVHRRETAGVVA